VTAVPVVDVPVVSVEVDEVPLVPTVLTTPVVSVAVDAVAVAPVEVTVVSTAAVSVFTFSWRLQPKAQRPITPIARSVITRDFFIRKTPRDAGENRGLMLRM